MTSVIEIQGAALNNLKRLSCQIPLRQFTVITGPSGSGKSTLAFDTLYAESQRRYLTSLSSYVRQFFERIDKPNVEQITHLPPAVGLRQHNDIRQARATVGSVTDVMAGLRALFAATAEPVCPNCGPLGHVILQTPQRSAQLLQNHLTQNPGTRLYLLLTLPPGPNQATQRDQWAKQGVQRVWRGEQHPGATLGKGAFQSLPQVGEASDNHSPLYLLLQRLTGPVEASLFPKLVEALQLAYQQQLTLTVLFEDSATSSLAERYAFRDVFGCVRCTYQTSPPSDALFSTDDARGACPTCEGFGKTIQLSTTKIVPNPSLSLKQGAILPFQMPNYQELQTDLIRAAKQQGVPVDTPWENLSPHQKTWVFDGDESLGFVGVRGLFAWLETKRYKPHLRIFAARFREYWPCQDCQGSGLNEEARQFHLAGASLSKLSTQTIDELHHWLINHIPPSNSDALPTKEDPDPQREILQRLQYRLSILNTLGLGYLPLNRPARTLSGGECQRVYLASSLGHELADTLYVLDEPSLGLHTSDTSRLIQVIRQLVDQGNTVVAVDHHPELILAADYLVELGPGGGNTGGEVVFAGTPEELLHHGYKETKTSLALNSRGSTGILTPRVPRSPEHAIRLTGAQTNNLKNITVSIPLERVTCVTGISGAGKSSLIRHTLVPALEALASGSPSPPTSEGDRLTPTAVYDRIETPIELDLVVMDQRPLSGSARSNPALYLKLWDDIRQLFAKTREAKQLGLTISDFSFNSAAGGRCPKCEGMGSVTVDLQFMADVVLTCEACQGRRFQQTILSVKVNDLSIDDVLNVSFSEAKTLLKDHKKLLAKITRIEQLGLGYLKLGQPLNTLSGGEAQRVKLASKLLLAPSRETPCLFVFDEPSAGLHDADVQHLIQVFHHLTLEGHTVICVDHQESIVKNADWMIELGPEGGEAGGHLCTMGVNTLSKQKTS